MTKKVINILTISAIVAMTMINVLPVFAQSSAPTAGITILGIPLNCDPAKSPAPGKGGCGFAHFANLVAGAIRFLIKSVVLPIGLLMLVWAGFVIITAGGSKDKVAKGKRIITVALTGIAISILASAAVGAVYTIITGGSFKVL